MKNPGVDAVSMTGSTQVGIGIAEIMAKRLAPCTLELGGNDAFIVMPDTDIDKAAASACGARKGNSGQICISSKRFIVHNSVKEEFTEKLVKLVREIEVGYDDNVEEMMERCLGNTDRTNTKGEFIGSLISERAAKEVEEQVAHTISQGAKLLCGGQRTGAFYMPTVLAGVTKDMDVAKDLEICLLYTSRCV